MPSAQQVYDTLKGELDSLRDQLSKGQDALDTVFKHLAALKTNRDRAISTIDTSKVTSINDFIKGTTQKIVTLAVKLRDQASLEERMELQRYQRGDGFVSSKATRRNNQA